jgi:PAS domain S-box-containing protein
MKAGATPAHGTGSLVSSFTTRDDTQQAGALPLRDELRLAIDTIPGLVWTARPDGHIDFLNQRWLEYTGLSLDVASGWGWQVAIHPDDLPALAEYWRSMLAAGTAGETEARLRGYDGEYRWFLFRGVPLYDEHGVLKKWYGQTTDIEDRKRAETLLQNEKRLLEMVARGEPLEDVFHELCAFVECSTGATCAILLFDGEGDRLRPVAAPTIPQTYLATAHSRSASTCAGPCGRAAYENRQVIVPDVERDGAWDTFGWRALALGYGYRACWSTPIRSSAGAVVGVFTLYSGKPGEPSPAQRGLIEQFTALASIAIERDERQAALHRARAELARVSRASTVGQLTVSIAHEVNQPLSGILANASVCVRLLTAREPDIEGAIEAARRTTRDANRAAEVIARLRALFRKKGLAREPFALNAAIEEVIALAGSEIQRSKAAVQAELAPERPAVNGDRTQIQQVVLNLTLNALEAMNGVDASRRKLTFETACGTDHDVAVTVRDSGVGIAADDAERIFQPFFTTKEGGMGMGLSISRSIIENHDGKLWVFPNDGGGAAFRFTLPRVDGA